MSVALISIEEFADLATSIKYIDKLSKTFFSWKERFFNLLYSKENGNVPNENEILCFVERLYLANRMAYYYQYADECKDGVIQIRRLEEHELHGKLLPFREILFLLRSIHYNLYTNAGRCFLGREDMERLERLMEACKEAMICNMEVH